MPGNSSWMPYAPQGVKGFDDMFSICASLSIQVTVGNRKRENGIGIKKM